MSKIFFFVSLFTFLFQEITISAEKTQNFNLERQRMVEQQIVARGVKDTRVLEAMRKVPRHLFVPVSYLSQAYADYPLPIGKGQTISQPYIVAFMTEAINLKPDDIVLEIGTGSGYQAAILAELVKEVYTIELIPSIGNKARALLKDMEYENCHVKIGNGYEGWPEKAPFDGIIVTCAPDDIPQALIDQLKEGGRIIIPVGRRETVQELVRGVKKNGKLRTQSILPVRFVPMVK